MSWYVLTTPSLCYAPPPLPIALPIAANSSEATTITVVDTHPYPECAGDVVGMCKADHFVADEAEEAVKGEKRGRGEEGERG